MAGNTALTTPMPASVPEKVGIAEFVFKDVAILGRLARPDEEIRPRFLWPLNSLKTRNHYRRISLIRRLVFTHLPQMPRYRLLRRRSAVVTLLVEERGLKFGGLFFGVMSGTQHP
ncbi:hypothetical protein [Ruegeria atlantica]|uniref:hypothetical protein n=1 Tax=Ruegeria atlantica TaxID=81569 RepID=UPI00147987EB|nr:hypothetical protein [Ruegeria atlantica]